MGIDRIRTHLYPAYLAYTRAMNISELGLNNFVIGIEQALKQHGNEHGFIKRHTKTGRRTAVSSRTIGQREKFSDRNEGENLRFWYKLCIIEPSKPTRP